MKKIYLFIAGIMHLQALSAGWCTIYSHGIVDGPSQIQRFVDAIATPQTKAVQFADAMPATNWSLTSCIDSAASALLGKNLNRTVMHMGQGNDLEVIQTCMQTYNPDANLILYGCSRGAAAIINYLAKYNPVNVKAIVLDGAPADMTESVRLKLASLGISPNYALPVFSTIFPAYPTDAVPPIHAIEQITNKQLPILIMHSQTDQRVSSTHACMLYQEFKRQGFSNIHLVMLPSGRHSFLLQDATIRPTYLKAVHNFYKLYGLPYDTAWGNQDFYFSDYQPSAAQLQDTIAEHEHNIALTYKKSFRRNLLISEVIIGILLFAAYLHWYDEK